MSSPAKPKRNAAQNDSSKTSSGTKKQEEPEKLSLLTLVALLVPLLTVVATRQPAMVAKVRAHVSSIGDTIINSLSFGPTAEPL